MLIGMVSGWTERLLFSKVAVLRVREPSPDRTAGLVFLGVSGLVALAVHLVDKTPDTFVCNYLCPSGTECCRGGSCGV